MIRCKKCGYEGVYTGPVCPECHEKIVLSAAEIAEYRRELDVALRAGEEETVVENYMILADAGDTAAEREYAKLLEKGGPVPRDIDRATEFFFRAAKKCDPYSAYRYSRLISRMSDELSKFWLLFSAALGCENAYLSAADYYAEQGKNVYANCYYYLAAAGGDSDAIVKLAMRYYNGDGIERSNEYAKWYMDKFTFPPLYALKLAYKLRAVKAEEPPRIVCEDYEGLIEGLIGQAKRLGFESAQTKLYVMLAEGGNPDRMCELAEHYLSCESEKNPQEAVRVLSHAAATGSARAYLMLGLMYRSGEHVKQNIRLALESFEHAASLGSTLAYEYMGDIYHHKDYHGRDVARACELFELAANGGSTTAAEKAREIRKSRENYFYRAAEAEDERPEDAFRDYSISALMGFPLGYLKVGECYALGIGTDVFRRGAFENYTKAVALGVTDAYLPLGVCYSRGIGTAFDFDLAVKYLTLAQNSGEQRARRELRRIYENKRRHLGDKLYSTAMRLIYNKKLIPAAKALANAMKLSHPKAIYTLGCLYEFGGGVSTDKTRAYQLYGEAAKRSFTDPRAKYKSTVLKMLKKQ
ncbi:MAG: sel1 repeat family protein [Clostridia bacterium]|nr:sel1 repeat family protein [Clostridia bacterium]